MNQHRYLVLPFKGTLQSGGNVMDVSNQLSELIHHQTQDGWEFYTLDSVDIEVKPGCLGISFGHQSAS